MRLLEQVGHRAVAIEARDCAAATAAAATAAAAAATAAGRLRVDALATSANGGVRSAEAVGCGLAGKRIARATMRRRRADECGRWIGVQIGGRRRRCVGGARRRYKRGIANRTGQQRRLLLVRC